MKRCAFIVLSMLLSALLGATAVWAQQKSSIELKVIVQQEKEVINAKREKEFVRIPVTRVVPGDEVVYTLLYTNIGKESADNVVITDLVPEHMIYTKGSASGTDTIITFSVDNGATYDLPAKLTIVGADGKKRPAKGSDYTHIRWTLKRSLAPGEKGQASFRARLE
jgi:uncharacterized repeat protein (TIGR01451 family)